MRWHLVASLLLLVSVTARAADGNRLTYLDGSDPYYVARSFPRLTTPQWVGEEGVEAVVVLAIDDMRDHEKYEAFLRPIARRLRQIDGRAPISIMTCRIDPALPHLQTWLNEGFSLEVHTYDHPCPLLKDGDFAKAKGTVDRCIDLLAAVPNTKPVAYRMPCCDSLNTLSPRFFAEIFNRTTAQGNFLAIDTSVFQVPTSNDPELPRGLVLDPDGRDKFLKYIPTDRSFVNTIQDYPYPYVINRLCWEFPCATPSDWEAQYLQKPNNPLTLRAWKAALDVAVVKRGTMNVVFHPHGWSSSDQWVELIDYAVATHGRKVKFLTFREALERLNRHLLGGQPLRAANGQDNGVRLLDLNQDGFLDVVIGNEQVRQTRLWSPRTNAWVTGDFPVLLTRAGPDGQRQETGVRFGMVRPDGHVSLLVRNETSAEAWHFDGSRWVQDERLLEGLEVGGRPVLTSQQGKDRGVRFRDLDRDGRCEVIVSNPEEQAVFAWDAEKRAWNKLPSTLPAGTSLVNAEGKDNGLRFVDLDEDGFDDVLFSNEERYSLHLFTSLEKGWGQQVLAGKRGDKNELPMITRNGSNQGAWFHSRHLWVQNEHTALLANLVDRRSFNSLLADVTPGPRSAEASLRALRPRPGFRVELAAAEPLVQDPVAFAWGPDGKLWVVEMADYPLGMDNKGKPGGRVKFLEDTKGDGKYTKATLFLDGLNFPTGVLPWRKGVLVTAAPEIIYAEDTDGDGKADVRTTLYRGFREGNQQHRVNGLAWGLDNWVYCANGDSGGEVQSVKTGTKVAISGRDLRIKPDEGLIDLQAGQTQFGRSRDDWGNWFGNNNSNPLWHYALADQYVRRNPHVAAPDARSHVPVSPGAARVYPVSRTLQRFNSPLAVNHFTSACSAIVYRDDLFGPAFENNTFVSEPVHNLVHREIMTAQGTTFSSRRAADEQESEFLASSDNWFRPTTVQTGPDGALWVADMYRFVIEHPEWIPKDWQQRLDLRAGHDKGRIYRVLPVGARPRAIPRLDRLDTAGLVAALDSPSGWQRDLAQQMLVWKQDRAAVPLLEKQAASSERALCRLHALCSLDGLNALRPDVLARALADPHPGVRRHAVRLCEPLLTRAPELGEQLLKLADDPDAQVRMQLACTLGEWPDTRAGRALGRLALQDAGDRYLSAAVLSSVNAKNLEAVLLAVMAESRKGPPPAALVENLLRLANAFDQPRALVTLLGAVARPEKDRYAAWQYTALAGLLDALDQRNTPLPKLQAEANEELKATLKQIAGLFMAARGLLENPRTKQADRLLAVRLLGRGLDQQAEDVDRLARLLTPQTPDELQAAAVAALGRLRDRRVPAVLVGGWKGYGPGLRTQVLDALFRRDEWVKVLLDGLEKQQVAAAEIDAARRQRLVEHKNEEVRKRALKFFAGGLNADRQRLVDEYQSVLSLSGDPQRGVALFTKHCSTCHKLGDVGQVVGPDLASLGDRSPQALLVAVLDPNRAVEARYVNYTAVTKNGLTLSGVLSGETGNSITLLGQDGKPQTVLRRDLDELISTGKSMMPEGLEKEIRPQDMADLFAHIGALAPPPQRKEFEGNKPLVVRPGKDGTLLLTALNGEIYGRSLVLEKQHGNLGYWTSDDDHVIWTVDVPRPGKYTVWLDWACASTSAGKPFVLQAGANQLTNKVPSTGTWDTYKEAEFGQIALSAGRQRLTFRAGRSLASSPLIDLRSVKLVPVKE